MQTLRIINYLVSVFFALCFMYQIFYIPVSLFFKKREEEAKPVIHDFAALICARNEETVIGDLIDNLRSQTYPRNHLHIFVMADNCTDSTALIASLYGATVYVRNDRTKIGKGYALEALLDDIREDYPEGFDGYFVFDADNLMKADYIEKMNEKFSEGYDIVTSYRNSKNYGDNWISAGYGLWFLRESRFLQNARDILGTSCTVSGTGFLFSREIEERNGGWPYHLLTEDVEFSADQISKGRKIAFCGDAVIYDEQPTDLMQSMKQRMRWSRGFIEVSLGYGARLFRGMLLGSFSCFDMAMVAMPAVFLTVASVICNAVLMLCGLISGGDIAVAAGSIGEMIIRGYLSMFALAAITTAAEWKRIHTGALKKVLYVFTFPVFMFTYVPVTVASFFTDVKWDHINHNIKANSVLTALKE